MTAEGFNFGAALAEGIVFSLILGLVSKKIPKYRAGVYASFVIFEIASVVMRYGGIENSTFFFFHPYLAFLVLDISDYSTYVRGAGSSPLFEKLLFWPLIVIPVFSAFVMTTGWMIKLYGRYLFSI